MTRPERPNAGGRSATRASPERVAERKPSPSVERQGDETRGRRCAPPSRSASRGSESELGNLATVLSYKPDMGAARRPGSLATADSSPRLSEASLFEAKSLEDRGGFSVGPELETGPTGPGGGFGGQPAARSSSIRTAPEVPRAARAPPAEPRRIPASDLQPPGRRSRQWSRQESAPDLVRPGASSTSGSKSSASKEASSSSKEVEEVSAPQGRRSKGKLLKSSRTSPSLPLIDVGSDLGGVRFEPGEGTPTSEFPMRQRRSGDRFGSDEWEGAPVKPRPQGLLVTAMRSQEWMSQVA